MKTIIIIAALFCVYKLITSVKSHRKEQARQEAEYRRQAEAARMRNEWRNVQAQAKVAIMKQEAMWKEQERLRKQAEREREELRKEQERQAREQERQAKEQVRLAKEQERQAAILERHEAEIRKAEYNYRQMKRKWEFLEHRLTQQETMLEWYIKKQEGMEAGTKEFDTMQNKIIVLENQIFKTKEQYNKAVFTAREAKRKMA